MSTLQGFALWITGIPASGKTSITRELVRQFDRCGIHAVVLESDEMRNILTPNPTYSSGERDAFYRQLALIGALITKNGVNVIFDATANRRSYRDLGRSLIPRFMEAFVTCPLDLCMSRDPKKIYERANHSGQGTVPGLQVPYEPPHNPEITLDGLDAPEKSANLIFDKLKQSFSI
jgi:adenylylsulfate kinase